MNTLGLLIVALLAALVDCNIPWSYPKKNGFQARRYGPDDVIERLAVARYKEYARDELLRKQAEFKEELPQGYQQERNEEAHIRNPSNEMNGQLFGPAYHRKLGHRFHHPLAPPEQEIESKEPMNDVFRKEDLESQFEPLANQNQEENHSVKETTIVKESAKPEEGKVISVEKVEPVNEEHEEEKIPQEELRPTPAYYQARESNGLNPIQSSANMADVYFLAVVAGCSVAGFVGLVVAGVCWYRLQKNVKAASEAEYPAYGITGPTKERIQSPGDGKLAQSAQMYHYQHQKQRMIALEKANSEMKQDGSDEDSEEENEEGDYTVYECPGLAPTGEMEVKNPLFSEDTPVTPTMPTSK